MEGRPEILGKNYEEPRASCPWIELSVSPISEVSSSAREFDARPDIQAYIQNKLGPSLRTRAYAPAIVLGLLGALPTVGVIGGLILFGPPSASAVPAFLQLLVPAALLLSAMVYFIWKARVHPPVFPTTFSLDAEGVYFRDRYGLHDLVDWDSPRLSFVLIDKRPYSSSKAGTTQVITVGGVFGSAIYPVPAPLFDLILHGAKERALAGVSQDILSPRGRVIRTFIGRRFVHKTAVSETTKSKPLP